MSENSKIEWCTHTFNPWWGCIKIAPECANCYAATFDHRLGGDHWGPGSERKLASEKLWAEPLKWNTAAKKAGERHRVFCASMADVFEEHPALTAQRARLWELIIATPDLDWLLLTKRPSNIWYMVPDRWTLFPMPNVWYGTTAGTRATWGKNVTALQAIPAAVRFVSVEPLLEDLGRLHLVGLDWVIVGGESGPGARPMRPEWAQSVRDQCAVAKVPYFFKQWGEYVTPHQMTEDQFDLFDTNENAAGHPGLDKPLRIGKVRAGRELDGVEWNEIPKASVNHG